MLNYDYIVDKTIEKMNAEIPETMMPGFTKNPSRDVSIYKKIWNDDLEGNGKIQLSDNTRLLFRKILPLVKKADQQIERGRQRGLSPLEMKRLKEGVKVQLFDAVEKIKRTRQEQLVERLTELQRKERNGNGLSSSEQLLRFERAKLEAASLNEQEAMNLLNRFEKDPLQSVNRDIVLSLITSESDAVKKKAREIKTGLPSSGSMTGEMKKILLEMVSLNESPIGGFQFLKADGMKMTDLNAADFLENFEAPKPSAADILGEKGDK